MSQVFASFFMSKDAMDSMDQLLVVLSAQQEQLLRRADEDDFRT